MHRPAPALSWNGGNLSPNAGSDTGRTAANVMLHRSRA